MPTESVKIDSSVVSKVRKQKKKSGINVGKFFELAALEKLARTELPKIPRSDVDRDEILLSNTKSN